MLNGSPPGNHSVAHTFKQANHHRAPPPPHSKPEASNFPNQIYDMSEDRSLFVPPAKYPDPPKDMWYEVPEKVPEPPKPKPIFPWEGRTRKPTRVFPTFKAPTPPPILKPEPIETPITDATDATYATDATDDKDDKDATQESQETESTPPAATGSPDLWQYFQQRTNAWDDMPEIEQYVRAFSQSRRGKIQVLHQAHTQSSGDVKLPPDEGRRPSMKVTDFPTEIERPSLPVTPAPIRRLSFWSEERDEAGDLPAAEGVPTQEEWVRRFSSYPKPEFPALSPPLPGFWRCQFCGRQNPISKLDELQRRQSRVLEIGPELPTKDMPTREMPGSKSLAEVEEKAISSAKASQMPKPVLREPKF
jgi:hypothetical protein